MTNEPHDVPAPAEPPDELDLDPLEESIAKWGLFIMKLDQAISVMPLIEINHRSRVLMMDLRVMADAKKKAELNELHRHRTPDS